MPKNGKLTKIVKYVRNVDNVTSFINNPFNTLCICRCHWCYKMKALGNSSKYTKNKKI